MVTIDVDSHFAEPLDWLEVARPDLADQLGPMKLSDLMAAGNELFGSLPPEHRPDVETLIPEPMRDVLAQMEDPAVLRSVLEFVHADMYAAPGSCDPIERVAFLDRQGIDFQIVLPTLAFQSVIRGRRLSPELGREIMSAYNRWAADLLDGSTGRLSPATLVDLRDLDYALHELTKMRALGSQCFLIDPSPVQGKSLAHPDFDRLWSAAVDLGMVPQIHIGGGRPNLPPGLVNSGRPVTDMLYIAFTQMHQVPEIGLTALIAGGVFERHPNLVIIVGEFDVGWLPFFLRRIDAVTENRVIDRFTGGWRLPLKPSEYVRRNVRVAPLRENLGVADTIRAVGPGLIVFASDYPHPEGSMSPRDHFDNELAGLPADTVDSFYGDAVRHLFEIAA